MIWISPITDPKQQTWIRWNELTSTWHFLETVRELHVLLKRVFITKPWFAYYLLCFFAWKNMTNPLLSWSYYEGQNKQWCIYSNLTFWLKYVQKYWKAFLSKNRFLEFMVKKKKKRDNIPQLCLNTQSKKRKKYEKNSRYCKFSYSHDL